MIDLERDELGAWVARSGSSSPRASGESGDRDEAPPAWRRRTQWLFTTDRGVGDDELPKPGTGRYGGAVVLGADACRAGWVGVLLGDGSTTPQVCVEPTFAWLVASASTYGPLDVIAVDMPIGLPEHTRRQADVLARARLGPRRSSVFVTPTRAALAEPTHATASAVNRDRAGEGISTQAYNLKSKLEEVEKLAFARAYRVVEVHPEVSFGWLAGAPLTASKETPDGVRERLNLLRRAGIHLRRPHPVRPGVGVDDVLDAAVAAWSGKRVLTGSAVSLPDPPEVFADGWPAAIWV